MPAGKGTLIASAEVARQAWVGDGWPEVTVEVTLYAMGTFAANAHTVVPVVQQQIDLARSLLGRGPRSFADWLSSHVTAFR